MRMFLKSAMVAIVVLGGGALSPAGPLDAFPSFSLTPGSPSAGVLTPGGILDPATGAPTLGGPQPPPVVAITAAALGVPVGGNVDGISYGDDGLLAAGAGAGPLALQFSVTNAAAGGFWLPPVPAQNVLTQGVAGEGAAGSDIFAMAAPVIPPPFGPVACGLGGNMQVYDGNGVNVFPPLFVPGIGGLIDPPFIGPFDDVDAYELLGPGAVDYQTFLSGPLSGPDGLPDAPVFFTVDPATAGMMGVSAAAVLVTDPGSATGWSVYAGPAALGLAAGDDIDALLVGDSAAAFPGLGGATVPARTFGPHPTDFVAFSLAPGSPSLAPLSPLPAVCAPGIKLPGDVWGTSPFIGAAPFPIFSSEGLGLCSVRVGCIASDNLDAMDVVWAGDADADGAPDALEPVCGAAIGPPDSDLDGLPDSIEMTLTTNPGGICTGFVPFAPPPGAAGLFDSDFDGLIDSWEIAYWTATCAATNPSLPDAGADTDGDGATNIVEQGQGTSPCLADTDADGFGDLAATLHSGPANLLSGVDNCPAVVNPAQANSDGNYTDLSPGRTFDDLTWPSSDALGDACDGDDDNDYIADATETGGPPCASATGATVPTSRDTDGDRMLDGAECTFGTNPNVVNAAPAACSTPGDADLDGVNDAREFCYYGTSTGSTNSDGDGCGDRREVVSINADLTVSATDLSQVASAFGLYVVPNLPHFLNFDVTKDGNINATDLSQVAQGFGPCP